MADTGSNPTSTSELQRGFRRTGWTVDDLWVAAVGVGGSLDHVDIAGITSGRRAATPLEHDVLATALNDFFVDRGQDHPVTIWSDLPA